MNQESNSFYQTILNLLMVQMCLFLLSDYSKEKLNRNILVYLLSCKQFIPVRFVVIVIVIVNSKLLKRHSKAKRRAPAYSRALRQIRGVFLRIVRGRLRSGCQNVRECGK